MKLNKINSLIVKAYRQRAVSKETALYLYCFELSKVVDLRLKSTIIDAGNNGKCSITGEYRRWILQHNYVWMHYNKTIEKARERGKTGNIQRINCFTLAFDRERGPPDEGPYLSNDGVLVSNRDSCCILFIANMMPAAI